MKSLTCPVCQSKYTLEEAATTGALRELVALAARFGKVWGLAEEYMDAFRTQQWGSVSLKKRVRLLLELIRLWETGEFAVNGKHYRADRTQIRAALNTVCNAEKIGFNNHNYLYKVLQDGAKRISAAGETAAEERKRENNRRRKSEVGSRKTDDSDGPMTAAQYRDKEGIKSLADQIGRDM